MKKAPLFLVLLLLASSALSDQAEIDALVSQLSAREFTAREEAGKALREIGMPARAALEKAAKSSDPELEMRAKEILTEIMLGIPASWPQDIRSRLNKFDAMSQAESIEVMALIATRYGADALPFLISQLEQDDPVISAAALKSIDSIPDKKKTWAAALDRIARPTNRSAMRLLMDAATNSGRAEDVVRVLGIPDLSLGQRAQLAGVAVKIVRARLDNGADGEAAKLAREFVKADKDDKRLVYILAVALFRDGLDEEAGKLMEQALLLGRDESERYSAGDLLLELRYLRQSEKEWLAILEMDPQGSVYDINAYMRLGQIYAMSGMYTRAAEMMETGQAMYQEAKEKAGSGMGMIGGDELGVRIAECRRLATEDEPEEVPEGLDLDAFRLTVRGILKKGDAKEMIKQEREADMILSANVEPHGLRLFEEAKATVGYDAGAGELLILLNGQPCGKGRAFVMKKETAKVVVKNLDMVYVFRVDRDAGGADKLETFEFDFKVIVVPGKIAIGLKEAAFKMNDKEYSWEDLAEGVDYDFLPKKLDILFTGVTPAGKKVEFRRSCDPLKILPTGKPAGVGGE